MELIAAISILTVTATFLFLATIFFLYVVIHRAAPVSMDDDTDESIKHDTQLERTTYTTVTIPSQMRKIGEFLYTSNVTTHIPSLSLSPEPVPTCYICMIQESTAVLIECGHSGICLTCARKLWNSTRRCPLCQRETLAILAISSGGYDGLVSVMPISDNV
jgi:hypothetical protein